MKTPPYTRIVTVTNPKTGAPVQVGVTGYDIEKGWAVVNIDTGKHGYIRYGIEDGPKQPSTKRKK